MHRLRSILSKDKILAGNQRSSKQFVIKESANTPFVVMTAIGNSLLMKGKCSPKYPDLFFDRITDLFDVFYAKGNKLLNIRFHLDYIDEESYNYLCVLINKFSQRQGITDEMNVVWFHDHGDEDSMVIGKSIALFTQTHMNLIAF